MIDCGSLDYAQARVQARQGQRCDEVQWRRLEVTRGLAALLELARGTALRPWLVGITADSRGPQVEATLRQHWRARVAEVASWMPPEWRAALLWCALLPDLSALQHWARGGAPPSWTQAGAQAQPLATATAAPADRAAALAGTPWAPLAGAWLEPERIGELWRSEWQRRWPQPSALAALEGTLLEHARAFERTTPDQAWPQRAALGVQLASLMRRGALQPVVAFAHLGLLALEAERLRAELLRRLYFRAWKGA